MGFKIMLNDICICWDSFETQDMPKYRVCKFIKESENGLYFDVEEVYYDGSIAFVKLETYENCVKIQDFVL